MAFMRLIPPVVMCCLLFISYVKNKSSLWTTFQAEINLATQKKRDTTMVTPEFGSKRIDTGMAFIGKMLSLFFM